MLQYAKLLNSDTVADAKEYKAGRTGAAMGKREQNQVRQETQGEDEFKAVPSCKPSPHLSRPTRCLDGHDLVYPTK